MYFHLNTRDKNGFKYRTPVPREIICKYLDVSRDTVLAWIDKREMPATKIGRLWKFKISEVDAWMKSGVAAEK